MSLEIERKFIVDKAKLKLKYKGIHIIQGYLSDNDMNAIRVRLTGNIAYITIKCAKDKLLREEFEYIIDTDDADYMLNNFCIYALIDKIRYQVEYCGHNWIVDIFNDKNEGLILAEIELKSEHEKFERPEWISNEVTNNAKYYNHNLAKYPFCDWK